MAKRPIVKDQLDIAGLPRQKPDALDQNRKRRCRPELLPCDIRVNSGSQYFMWRRGIDAVGR